MKKYWVLKTRADIDRQEFIEQWPYFTDRSKNQGNTVIAVGWGVGPNNGEASLQQLIDYMKKEFYRESNARALRRAKIAARTVLQFINDMNVGDEVLLCQGYIANQKQGVRVYGIARITGGYWEDKNSGQLFMRKRNADLTVLERDVPKDRLAGLLGKNSLLKTIHEVDSDNFRKTKAWLIGKVTFRNPDWTRDELILALDLYFRVNPVHTTEKHPEIVQLSRLLNSLPIHPRSKQRDSFRNPNGVYMKLCNFLRLDPSYTGEGLDAGSKLDIQVWDEFHSDRKRLSDVVDAIRKNYPYLTRPRTKSVEADVTDEDEEFPEGRILSRSHRYRERNHKLVAKKKEQVLNNTGTLVCEACLFDFGQFYGDMGQGFAECHHNIPVAELKHEQHVKLSDLSILCPNCHRMIHRRRPWLLVHQLKDLLVARGKLHISGLPSHVLDQLDTR